MTVHSSFITVLLFAATCFSNQDRYISVSESYAIRSASIYKLGIIFNDSKLNKILLVNGGSITALVEPSNAVLDFSVQNDTLEFITKLKDTVFLGKFDIIKQKGICINKFIVSGITGFPYTSNSLIAIPVSDSLMFVSKKTGQPFCVIPENKIGSLHDIYSTDGQTVWAITDIAQFPKVIKVDSQKQLAIFPLKFSAQSHYLSATLFDRSAFLSDVKGNTTIVQIFSAPDYTNKKQISIKGKYILRQVKDNTMLFYSTGTFRVHEFKM